MTDWTQYSLVDAVSAIQAGEVSSTELVNAALDRIEQLDPELKAFVAVADEEARREATRLDKEAKARGLRGPLHGIPIGLKDLVDTAGIRTASGSRLRANRVPTIDATVVTRLKRAGAIVIGKTNTHEFAFGPITAPTRNAWDPSRIPGGSSGGSATAVATGMCMGALGTDTGGSIRIPASFNGIVGLKPTYGRVPKSGITALSFSLDHVGPMTRSVADAAAVLNVIAGHDPSDPTSAREPVEDYAAGLDSAISDLRLGIPKNYFHEIIQPEVLELVDAAADHLRGLGARLVEVTMPTIDLSLAAALGILVPEASVYHQLDLRRTPELYGSDVRTYLELGELHLATHYLNAQRARTMIKEGLRNCFVDAHLDGLLVPTTPMLPPLIGQTSVTYPDVGEQPLVGTVVRTSAPFNLSGQPVLTVPCGFSDDQLPVGLGIVGRPFDEATVLRIGSAYERSTNWHERWPPCVQRAR